MTSASVLRWRGLTAIAFLAWVGCSDEPSGPRKGVPLSSAVIVSEPTTGTGNAPSGQRGNAAGGAVANTVYVSLASGSFPGAALAVVRSQGSALAITRAMVEGGLDPVAIRAVVGDTVVVELHSGAGVVEKLYSVVPPSRRPRVVRTVPPRRKTDVPLNQLIEVVFSEPIDARSLVGIGLNLSGVRVNGSAKLAADGLRAELLPEQALAANTDYVLSVSTDVQDRDGDHLEEPVFVEFSTGGTSAVASIGTTEPAVFAAPSNGALRTFEMQATLRSDGSVAGRWSIFYASTGGRRTGHMTCFTIIDSLVWAAGVTDSGAAGPLGVGSEWGWRAVVSSQSPAGLGDQLSLAYLLDPDTTGTAADFCAEALTSIPKYGAIQTYDLLSGDIAMTGTTPGRTAGGVRVFADMSGDDPDADGYTVRVGTKTRRLARPTVYSGFGPVKRDTLVLRAVPAGLQTVSAEGLSPNCSYSATSVTVQVGKTANLGLSVRCLLATAGVRLSTRTTGPDPDTNGYVITAGYNGIEQRVSMPPNGGPVTLYGRIDDLTLSGAAVNCDVVGDNPKQVAAVTQFVDVTIDVACEAAGTLAYAGVIGDKEAIYTMKSNGEANARLTTSPGSDGEPAWSPDGKRIAFRSDRDGNANIYVMNADGSGLVRLTSDTAADYSPTWSPDGGRIVFVRELNGNAELYAMDSEGGSVKRLTNDLARDDSPAYSPDGAKVAFRSDRHGNGEIYVMDADGSNVARLTNNPADDVDPAWSPDGSKLAFSRFTTDVGEVGGCPCYEAMIMNVDGSGVKPLVVIEPEVGAWVEDTYMRGVAWSPDGKRISLSVRYCWSDVGDCHEIVAIWIVNLAAGDAHEVFRGIIYDPSPPTVFPYNPSWRPPLSP